MPGPAKSPRSRRPARELPPRPTPALQSASSNQAALESLEEVHPDRSSGSGSVLDAVAADAPPPDEDVPYQADMEAVFGVSFEGLKVSLADPEPARVGANATYDGRQVRFADTAPSRETVAHELAHVVQPGEPAGSGAVEAVHHPAEQEAAAVAPRAAAGQRVDVHQRRGAGVHREATAETQAAEASEETSALSAEGPVTVELGEHTADPGVAPQPIRLAWEPRLVADTEILDASLDFAFRLDFVPELSKDEGATSNDLYVDTTLSARGAGRVAAELGKTWTQDAIEHDDYEVNSESSAALQAHGSAEASAQASYSSRRRTTREAFEAVRSALHTVATLLQDLEDAYREGMRIAEAIQEDGAAMLDTIPQAIDAAFEDFDPDALERAFRTMVPMAQNGADLGTWAGELVILGEELGNVLIVGHKLGGQGLEVFGTVLGEAEQARALQAGEGYEIRLEAAAGLDGGASLDGSVGGAPVSASAEISRDDRWERCFNVRAVGNGFVEISVNFERDQAASGRADVGVGAGVRLPSGHAVGIPGVASIGRSEQATMSEGHAMVVQLHQQMPEFDDLYDAVFSSMTPAALVGLTHHRALRWDPDGEAGIKRLALDTSWMGDELTSALMGGNGADGMIGGGSEGDHRSHVVIDYERSELSQVSVDSGGRDRMRINLSDNQLSRDIDALSEEYLGVSVMGALPDFELEGSRNDWVYDGETASFTERHGRLSDAAAEVRVVLGVTQLHALSDRAASASDWDDAGAMVQGVHFGFADAWSDLGASLRTARAGSQQRHVDLSPPVPGAKRSSVDLVLADPADSMATTALAQDPWIPPDLQREWGGFLVADAVGAFVAWADATFSAEVVTNAFLKARGQHFGSGDSYQEYGSDYSEIGFESGGRHLHTDGMRLADGDWFIFYEDRARALTDELQQAALAAHADQQRQLERQRVDHTAKSNDMDPDLVGRAEAHLAELRALQSQIDGHDASARENADSVGSQARFLEDLQTDLGASLADYQRAFGRTISHHGYAVSMAGHGTADFTRELGHDGEGGRQARETDRATAGRLAETIWTAEDSAEVLLERWEDTPEDDLSTLATTHAEVADALGRVWLLLKEFQAIYARHPKGDELEAPEDLDRAVWTEGIRHPRRDFLVRRSRARDTGWTVRADYKDDLGIAEGHEVEDPHESVPDKIVADDQFFAMNHPLPAAITDRDGYLEMSEAAVRDLHDELGPAALRTLAADPSAWGLTDAAREAIFDWASEIARVLSYEGSTTAGKVWVVEGHTDPRDSRLHNAYLGHRRALAVRQTLVHAGLPGALLTVRSVGEVDADAAVDETDEEALQQDRTTRTAVKDAASLGQSSGNNPYALADARHGDEGDAAADRRWDRMPGAVQEDFEDEAAAAAWQERQGRAMHAVYGDRPDLIVGLTTAASVLGRAEVEKLLDQRSGDTLRWKAYRAALSAQGLGARLPVNELALADDGAADVSFQPAVLTRPDRYTAVLTARVAKLGGLDLFHHGNAVRRFLGEVLERRILRDGGPSVILGDVFVEPEAWTLSDDGALEVTLVSGSDGGVSVLDLITQTLTAHLDAGEGEHRLDEAAPLLLGERLAGHDPAHAETAAALRTRPVTWRVEDGVVERISPDPEKEGWDTARAGFDTVWPAHIDAHLDQLSAPVQVNDGGAHAVPLGALCRAAGQVETDAWGAPTRAIFDLTEARRAWLEAAGRPEREARPGWRPGASVDEALAAFAEALPDSVASRVR